MVYVAHSTEEFPSLDQPAIELIGDNNVVDLEDIDIKISSDEKYKWRVDCVEGPSNKRRKGDV